VFANVAAGLLLLLGPSACGGESGAKRARAERHQEPESESESGSESGDEGASDEAAAQPAARENICADGTCFRCGEGICPIGFYCDEGVEDGAACSWLPSCPARASCKCIEQTLGSGCSCQESGGGPKVSCG
jgi:hypothetical protein